MFPEFSLPVLLLIAIFGGTGFIVKIITDHRLRSKVLAAGKLDIDPAMIKSLFSDRDPNRLAALKWGLIAFFAGIGLVIIHTAHIEVDSVLPLGIELTAISAGFLVYFFIAKKMSK